MKKTLLTLLTLAAVNASAVATTKTIQCGFTEPFLTVEIDLEAKVVTMISPSDDGGIKTEVLAKNAQVITDLSDPFAPQYQILKESGEFLMDLKMDMQGSNGMSETIYPISAEWIMPWGQKHWGGCETNLIKAHNPDQYDY